MRSPTLLLIRMNAAETSASSAIADWTPLTVVSRSSTTAEIDTFISDVSTTSTNIAAAEHGHGYCRASSTFQYVLLPGGRSPPGCRRVRRPVCRARSSRAGSRIGCSAPRRRGPSRGVRERSRARQWRWTRSRKTHGRYAPATALHQRLDGHYPQLLPEWLALAAERGLRPPPELVPALLDLAAVDPSLHAAVGAAAGPLGRWLAERRSHWAFVHGAGEDVEEIWAEGGSDERRALFERLRGSDPAAGRAPAGAHVRRRDLGGPRGLRRDARDRPLRRRRTAAGARARRPPQARPRRRRAPARRPPALALRRPHGRARRPAAARRGREAARQAPRRRTARRPRRRRQARRRPGREVAAPNACTRCWPRRRWRRGRARSGSRRPRRAR